MNYLQAPGSKMSPAFKSQAIKRNAVAATMISMRANRVFHFVGGAVNAVTTSRPGR